MVYGFAAIRAPWRLYQLVSFCTYRDYCEKTFKLIFAGKVFGIALFRAGGKQAYRHEYNGKLTNFLT